MYYLPPNNCIIIHYTQLKKRRTEKIVIRYSADLISWSWSNDATVTNPLLNSTTVAGCGLYLVVIHTQEFDVLWYHPNLDWLFEYSTAYNFCKWSGIASLWCWRGEFFDRACEGFCSVIQCVNAWMCAHIFLIAGFRLRIEKAQLMTQVFYTNQPKAVPGNYTIVVHNSGFLISEYTLVLSGQRRWLQSKLTPALQVVVHY